MQTRRNARPNRRAVAHSHASRSPAKFTSPDDVLKVTGVCHSVMLGVYDVSRFVPCSYGCGQDRPCWWPALCLRPANQVWVPRPGQPAATARLSSWPFWCPAAPVTSRTTSSPKVWKTRRALPLPIWAGFRSICGSTTPKARRPRRVPWPPRRWTRARQSFWDRSLRLRPMRPGWRLRRAASMCSASRTTPMWRAAMCSSWARPLMPPRAGWPVLRSARAWTGSWSCTIPTPQARSARLPSSARWPRQADRLWLSAAMSFRKTASFRLCRALQVPPRPAAPRRYS